MACPRCQRPWGDRLYCDQDGTLRQSSLVVGQRYELTALLGVSAMGFVYEARHVILGKRVAVKILRPELCDTPQKVKQLLRSIQQRSQLKHENIADVTDFGRDGHSGLYLVRELLTGTSLADLLTLKGRLPAKRAFDILRQICHALDAAHAAGVSHRNLTPDAVFITTESGRPMVKLLDFAITRDEVTTGAATTGEAMRTTPYRAPEQLRQAPGQDHRVDLYALGVIVHEMLTGELPFRSMTRADLLVEKMGEACVDLKASALRDSAPAMAQLVAECLSPSPGRRPASAAELEQRLFASGGRVSDQPEDLEGVRAGSYRLVKLLGKGGLGSVWLGEHPVIASKVAIKILHPEMCDSEEAVRRFVVEAQAVNLIDSPHIVKTFDFGKLPDKRDYAVMELLEGETLADRIERQGPIAWPQARAIAVQLLRALQSAHAAGIVHRDLKPENIHLGPDEKNPKVKVLDFGIAKLMDAGDLVSTKRGFCIGTPLYAAPEQMIGEEIGPPADIYAFGVVIYEMLSGQPPFSGGLKEVVKAKVGQGPTPLSDLTAGLPEGVVNMVQALLAPHPDDRPTAAGALALFEETAGLGTATPGEGSVPFAVVAPPGVDPETQRQFADIETVRPAHTPVVDVPSVSLARDTLRDPVMAVLPEVVESLETPEEDEDLIPLTASPPPLAAPATSSTRPSRGKKIAAIITAVAGLVVASGLFAVWYFLPESVLSGIGRNVVSTMANQGSAPGEVEAVEPPPGPEGDRTAARPHVAPGTRAAVAPPPRVELKVLKTPAAPRRKEAQRPRAERTERAERTDRSERPAVVRDAGQLIWVRSTPSGASVLMDGRRIGRTPLKLRVTRRSLPMELTFDRQGFNQERRVLREGEVPRQVQVSLRRDTSGWVDPFHNAEPVRSPADAQPGKPAAAPPGDAPPAPPAPVSPGA